MRVLIQRVQKASVEIDQKIHTSIEAGLLLFLGIHQKDTQKEADYLIKKCLELRLFSDEQDKMNLSALDLNKEILLVSQFTLYGSCTQGRRPEFTQAAPPVQAKVLYNYFLQTLKKLYPHVQAGVFGAKMNISLVNDGPITLWLDKEP